MEKKSDQLLDCPNPIMFAILCTEFLYKLADYNVQHQQRCISTAKGVLGLGTLIENKIKEENQLKYLVFNYRDIKKRNVLTIASQNRFYEALDDTDIGSIVTKM